MHFESSDAGIRIWDLKTKHCLYSHFYQESGPRCTPSIHFFGDLIADLLASCDSSVHPNFGTGARVAIARLRLRFICREGSYLKHGERLLSIFQGRIMSFDIHAADGDPQDLVRVSYDGHPHSYIDSEKLVAVCNNRWLLTNIVRRDFCEGRYIFADGGSGVCVIDITTGAVKQFLQTCYSDVTQSSDLKSFYAVHNPEVDVLELSEEGFLSRKRNPPCLSSQDCWVHAFPHNLVAAQNNEYNGLRICNPIDGKMERCLQFPLRHALYLQQHLYEWNGSFCRAPAKADFLRCGFPDAGPAVIAVYLAKT